MNSPHAKPPVILVVESEVLVRIEVTDMLIGADYRVIAAADAAQALAVLQVRADIRVLFTNTTLPGALDGCALARTVSTQWPGTGILIVSASGWPGLGHLPTGARLLSRPYVRSELLQELTSLLAEAPPL